MQVHTESLMPHSKAGKTNAEASQVSRDALLRAGTELLAAETQRNPFAAITLRDVCQRAGRSTGTFYAHWDSADSFYKELATNLMAEALTEDFDELMRAASTAAASPGAGAILHVAEQDITLLLSNNAWDAIELLNVTWARSVLRAPAVEGYRTIDRLTGDTYDVILNRLGREPRPPLTLAHIGAILQALVEGFGFRAKIDRDGTHLDGPDSPQLYPLAVASILAILTRRHGDHDTANQALEQTLGNSRTSRSRHSDKPTDG
jgi:AcrR family transcriptional regulator